MSKFNVLTFYKRFDKNAEFAILKDFVFNGAFLKKGDKLDKTNIAWHKLKLLWQVRKIGMILSDKVAEEAPVEEVLSQAVVKYARVEKAGVWYKVYNEKGEQIGKPTRDETEAELIKIDYEQ